MRITRAVPAVLMAFILLLLAGATSLAVRSMPSADDHATANTSPPVAGPVLVGDAVARAAGPARAVSAAAARQPVLASAVVSSPEVAEVISGAIVTQTFTLAAGWNSIYLGVEPVNSSPLVNQGTPDKPVWSHEKSTMEAIFGPLAVAGSLDSVWTYNQPVSSKDYIVDPGEGLWDAPGWERYIPKESVGSDGQPAAFLTTLHTLHANTGYLVKLADGFVGQATLTVYGKPVPGHHRWQAGAYNLAGFPIGPGQAPAVAAFTAGSPVTEIRKLTADGKWTAAMAPGDTLAAGVAYLVRYAENPSLDNFTAPLDLASASGGALPSDGLQLKAGPYGNRLKLQAKNLTASATQFTLSLLEGAASQVALYYAQNDTTSVDLRTYSPVINLGNTADNNAAFIEVFVPAEQQPAAGETLLAITDVNLGTRWLLPVAAQPASRAGLWVGDVVVNDVSESRLGGTDASEGDLAVSLAPASASGVSGAAALHEVTPDTLAVTVTLALPSLTPGTYVQPAPQGLFVHGYVFVDTNQNGQRDVGEAGLAAAQVTLSGVAIQATQADGSYLFDGLQAGTYNISLATPDGYAGTFPVSIPAEKADEPPAAGTNAWPASITLSSAGATAVTPAGYLAQVLAEPPQGYPYLPHYDETGQRVEPRLNFGLVRSDAAAIVAGYCDQAGGEQLFSLGAALNGALVTSIADTLQDLLQNPTHVAITRAGATVACGNLLLGAPTSFSDGRGSEAKFRIILRVNDAGNVEIVPYYVITGTQRVSAVNFLSLQGAIMAGAAFGQTNTALEFDLTLPGNDPLNPFKHKYNPDHDNLDATFNPISPSAGAGALESYAVSRRVTLSLTALPYGGDASAARAMDWGGVMWGGDYREVVEGLHKNSITARGHFVIRQVLTGDKLAGQDYDK